MKTTDRALFAVTRAIAAAAALSAAAWAHAAPHDPASNPEKLNYSNIKMDTPDYDVPFQREGRFSDPSVLRQIAPGLPVADVTRILGQPLDRTSGSKGEEWDYHLRLRMPESENYLVCQYKVVIDSAQKVKESVWRRHQCLDIVEGTAPR
ncbi:hypothetical protein ACFO0J_12910 [Castellaniella hirudinis]|uniref:Outer membrane protein assembly factor BamE n=1 Tax=Castellaniella hirudinis TaxID=1144617 RepID=A0ABV8S1J4_9BURK